MVRNEEFGMGKFDSLPPGMLEIILLNVSSKDILRLSCCSRSLWRLCQSEHLWKRVWLHQHCKDVHFKGSWKATVLASSNAPKAALPKIPAIDYGPASQSLYHQRLHYRCHYRQNPSRLSIPRQLGVASRSAGDGLPGHDTLPTFWTGLMQDWTTSKWTQAQDMSALMDVKFRVEKPSAGAGMMTLQNYLEYASLQHDEDPLYIFDGDFADRAPSMAEDYRPPVGCPEDLFSVLGGRRPDYRWFIMGPVRSGSTWHQDPSGTCAWNALVAGKKRWLFYPPERIPPGVKVEVSEDGSLEVNAPSPVQWLLEVYPNLKEEERPFERVQEAGEIVFLPSQWWHFIINLTDTIAVTENFVPEFGLEAAVKDLALGSGHAFKSDECLGSRSAENPEPGTDTDADNEDGSGDWPKHEAPNAIPAANKDLFADSEDQESPQLGFLRSRSLGPWMRALAAEKPHLLPQLVQLGSEHARLQEWIKLVTEVAVSNGIAPPKGAECFPISGGPSVLFQIGDKLLKFYSRPSVGSLDAFLEITTLKALTLQRDESSECCFPKLIASSQHQLPNNKDTHAEEPAGETGGADGEVDLRQLQWCLMTACGGQPADTLGELSGEVSQAIAHAVARIHSLDTTPVLHDNAEVPLMNGGAHSARGEEGVEVVLGGPFFKDEVVWEETEGRPDWTAEKPWGPFLRFLKRRRSEISIEAFSSASLPRHLVDQLETYLPQEMSSIISEDVPPTWLHGDLSSGNILVGEGKTSTSGDGEGARGLGDDTSGDSLQVSLVDFGDSGHGDPLYDFVPLHIDAFGCKQERTAAFLAAYRDQPNPSKWDRIDGLRSSYVAMCYTILHEQELLHEVFSHHPEWWNAESLECLESWLWGFLNEI